MTDIEKLKNYINDSKKICVFTGAGISCPSGIPDFRSANGIYHQDSGTDYSPEEIISHSFFMKKTELFFDFYKTKMLYPQAKPNAAHRYFAELEKTGKQITIVTQNIDGLHQEAGSKRVIELHGSVQRNYCMTCGAFYDGTYVSCQKGVPHCAKDNGIIKPDVVLYEENLKEEDILGAVQAIREADLMLVIGTSLIVYPAASFVRYFQGKHLVLINQSETAYDESAEMVFHEDVIKVIGALRA